MKNNQLFWMCLKMLMFLKWLSLTQSLLIIQWCFMLTLLLWTKVTSRICLLLLQENKWMLANSKEALFLEMITFWMLMKFIQLTLMTLQQMTFLKLSHLKIWLLLKFHFWKKLFLICKKRVFILKMQTWWRLMLWLILVMAQAWLQMHQSFVEV